MKVYDLEFSGIDLSNHHDYVLAENIDEAYRKAKNLLAQYQKNVVKDAELVTVGLEFEITDVGV